MTSYQEDKKTKTLTWTLGYISKCNTFFELGATDQGLHLCEERHISVRSFYVKFTVQCANSLHPRVDVTQMETDVIEWLIIICN